MTTLATKRPEYTAAQFEMDYSDASGVSIAILRECGRTVQPCDCDYEKCRGWQMVRPEWARSET